MARRKKIRVDVTPEHIEHAIQHTSTNCAIAMAIKETNPHFFKPLVREDRISFTNLETEERYTWKLDDMEPAEAQRIRNFIHNWDGERNAVRPTTIELDVSKAEVRPMVRQTPTQLIKLAQRVRDERTVRKATGAGRYSERP